MKSLVVYSSQTGNTRKLAEAVFKALCGEKARYYLRMVTTMSEIKFWQ